MRYRLIFFAVLCISVQTFAQKGFQFETAKNKVTIPFKLINNLIFIPVTVNGVPLNFLLDTGVEETILLSLEDKSAVNLFNVQRIKFKGLGSEDAVEGLKSSNNVLEMNGLIDRSHDLYIVLDQSFNFSTHVGIPVNGIIGYHFFKNNLIAIDYDKKKIFVYQDNMKIRKKLAKKYQSIPITIEKSKPYIIASVIIDKDSVPTKLLVDIGNSDALWLFKNQRKGILLPKKNFEDYLGKGFSGDITGNRTKISSLSIGKFEFQNPIVAFPDSVSVKSVTMVQDRAGSVGGEIFKRFSVVFDYRNNTMYLKKSGSFGADFHYNMSGIEFQNDGVQWVQETVSLNTVLTDESYDINGKKNSFKYKFTLKPVYTVASLRKDSAAEQCGLEKGDVLISINNQIGYKYSLEQINDLLRSEDGKWININIERNGKPMKFKFQLQNIL